MNGGDFQNGSNTQREVEGFLLENKCPVPSCASSNGPLDADDGCVQFVVDRWIGLVTKALTCIVIARNPSRHTASTQIATSSPWPRV